MILRRLLLLLIIIAELNHRLVEVLGSARVQGGGRGSEGGALAGFERLGLLAATVRTQPLPSRHTRHDGHQAALMVGSAAADTVTQQDLVAWLVIVVLADLADGSGILRGPFCLGYARHRGRHREERPGL